MHNILALFKTMRPQQWTKNLFIFAALVFDEKVLVPEYLVSTLAGFALFSLISGVVYTVNDLVDLENDRHHPKKSRRPLASGELSPSFAIIAAIVITVGALTAAAWVNTVFAGILATYLVLQFAYSFFLKRIVLLDVMAIAGGFVLRVGGGVPLVNAERFSPWLYICTTLLALFLALGKRRGELVLLGNDAENHRAILREYTLPLLDQLISLVTSSTILAYSLYTFSAPNLPGNYLMMLSIPFVIYGFFRYLYLIHVRGVTAAPDEVLLTDRPLQVDLILWGVTSFLILYN